jgi:hypothetical protein
MALSRQVRRFAVQLALRAFRRKYEGLRPSTKDAQTTELAEGDLLIHILGEKPAPRKTAWLVRANTLKAVPVSKQEEAELARQPDTLEAQE